MQSFIEKKSKMHAMNAKSTLQSRRGFTLVELMIVVLLTAIAVIAIYRGYTAFSHSVDVQEQIIEMQQNLRIGMYWLEKDLRRAGMNEEDDEIAGFRLDRNNDGPGPSSLSFTMDLGGTDAAVDDEDTSDGFEPGDGGLTDVGEWLTYKLVPVAGTTFFNLVKTDENNGNPDVPVDMTLITNVDA
jgi:prepilin-type N-terminal cleavage/methylation domain-containing protein